MEPTARAHESTAAHEQASECRWWSARRAAAHIGAGGTQALRGGVAAPSWRDHRDARDMLPAGRDPLAAVAGRGPGDARADDSSGKGEDASSEAATDFQSADGRARDAARRSVRKTLPAGRVRLTGIGSAGASSPSGLRGRTRGMPPASTDSSFGTFVTRRRPGSRKQACSLPTCRSSSDTGTSARRLVISIPPAAGSASRCCELSRRERSVYRNASAAFLAPRVLQILACAGKTGEVLWMKEPDGEGIASHTDSESCDVGRTGRARGVR